MPIKPIEVSYNVFCAVTQSVKHEQIVNTSLGKTWWDTAMV